MVSGGQTEIKIWLLLADEVVNSEFSLGNFSVVLIYVTILFENNSE